MFSEHLESPKGCEVTINKSIHKHVGNADEPTITFENDLKTGWYLSDKGEVTFTSSSSDNIVYNKDYTEYTKPIILDDGDTFAKSIDLDPTCGMLYKKTNDNGLWWKTPDGDINIITNLSKTPDGTEHAPSYGFKSSSGTGLFLQAPNTVSVSAGGSEKLRIGPSTIRHMEPIELIDVPSSTPSTSTLGRLYKKAGSDGLWWSTLSGEINLVDKASEVNQSNNRRISGVSIQPIQNGQSAPNGNQIKPAYGFSDSAGTGMFSSGPCKISFSAGGIHIIDIDKDKTIFNKPIELLGLGDNVNLSGLSSGNGMLFKRASSNRLWWQAAGAKPVALVDTSALDNLITKDEAKQMIGQIVSQNTNQLADKILKQVVEQNASLAISQMTNQFASQLASQLANQLTNQVEPQNSSQIASQLPKPKLSKDEISNLISQSIDQNVKQVVSQAVAQIPKPDIFAVDVRQMIDQDVSQAVSQLAAQIPKPDIFAADVNQIVSQAVSQAVAQLPKSDIFAADVSQMIDQNVSQMVSQAVSQAVAQIPKADISAVDVNRIVSQAVSQAVAQLPKPDISAVDVKQMVSQAVAQIPKADIFAADVKQMIDQNIKRTIAQLPKPDIFAADVNRIVSQAVAQIPKADIFAVDVKQIVAQLPKPDIFAADVKQIVAQLPKADIFAADVNRIVSQAIAQLPKPDIFAADVNRIVSQAMAQIPKPDIFAADVKQIVAQLPKPDIFAADVKQIVAQIPKPDIFATDVKQMIDQNVSQAVAQLPKPGLNEEEISNLISQSIDQNVKQVVSQAVGQSVSQAVAQIPKADIFAADVKQMIDQKLEFPMLGSIGGPSSPTYSFTNDKNTGMYHADNNTIGFSSNGKLSMSVSQDALISFTPLVLKDTTSSEPLIAEEGHLYKKSGSSGLWWSTSNEETNLLQTKFPILNNDGSAKVPVYSFNGNTSTGIYRTYDDSIGFSISGEQVVSINQRGILLNGTTISCGNQIITIDDSGKRRTYVGSESFVTGDNNINSGDIVGLTSNVSASNVLTSNLVKLDKVSGGKWSSFERIMSVSKSTSYSVYTDGVHHAYTYEYVNQKKSVLMFGINDVTVKLDDFDVTDEFPLEHIVAIVKVSSNKYVVIYGLYRAISEVVLKKISINNETLTVEGTTVYIPKGTAETLDAVYENALDILILGLYRPDVNSFEAALFTVEPSNDFAILPGYADDKFSLDPIIGNEKTMRLLLLPGQVVIFSYANSKNFLLLPSNANTAFSSGDTIVDSDSMDCVDLIYDTTNGVILSVEKTISNTCFIQVLDIFGTKMEVIRTKKFGSNTVIPLGLGFNPVSNNFILVYVDGADNVKAQIFTHDGEQIKIGTSYLNPGWIYNNKMDFIKHTFMGEDGNLIVCCPDGTSALVSASFNDNYGIQPSEYIGIALDNAPSNSLCEVILKGQVYYNITSLPASYLGKKIYLDSTSMHETYPANLTINAMGNVFIGTCISLNKILIGL